MDSEWPVGRAIVVSDDEARGSVVAAHFPDSYLTRPGVLRESEPGTVPASHVVVLAGVDLGRALSELLPRLADDATLLVESLDDAPPDVPATGWHQRGVHRLQGFNFVELRRASSSPVSTPGTHTMPADATRDGSADGPAHAPVDEAGSSPVTEPTDPSVEAGAGAGAAAVAGSPTASSTTPSTADAQAPRTAPPSSRRTLLLLTAAGAVCLVVAFAASLTTTTGYVGFAATLAVLVVIGGVAGLAWLQRREMKRVRGALTRHRDRDRAERSSETNQLVTATSSLESRTTTIDTRLRSVEHDLHVLTASALETARRLPQPRTPETFTDPHELTAMHQTQAIANLFALVPVRGAVPFMGGWAASPDLVLTLVSEVLSRRPALVVECGSGVSTLWLSLVIDHFGLETRIVSLDHDPSYAEQTRQTLRDHGVAHVAEVRDAPLAPTGLPGHPTPWYSLSAIEDLHDIGLLFVDGPPDATGPLVRLPAVPLLKERLAEQSSIVLDDVIRAGEQEVTARWAAILPDHTLTHLPLQKNASRFRRG